MRIHTTGAREAALTGPTLVGTLPTWPALTMPGLFRRAGELFGDALLLIGLAFCIPLLILVIGTPIAVSVQLAVWIIGMIVGAL